MRKIARDCPRQSAQLHRVLVRHSQRKDNKRNHYGFWSSERNVILQSNWSDGSPLIDTSTAQLRTLQALQRHKPHSVAARWERELGCGIPVQIWQETWLSFRGASENTFLWQLFYRAIATQRWRFPSIPPDDPQIRCTRCDLGVKEDIVHCVWSCPLSHPCWQWGFGLLKSCSEQRHRVGGIQGTLDPSHVFVASPLPINWMIPRRFWQILRAVICWQVWKARNEHFMAERQTDPRRTIRKSWHRFSMYLRKEWAHLRRKILSGRIDLAEAERIMKSQFGTNQEIWAVQGLVITVPPVPPRPP